MIADTEGRNRLHQTIKEDNSHSSLPVSNHRETKLREIAVLHMFMNASSGSGR